MLTTEEKIAVLEAKIDALTKRLEPRKTAHISKYCEVGESVDIAPDAHLMAGEGREIQIGSRSKILRGAEWIGPIIIGAGCYFNIGSYVRANVTVGDNVMIGPFVRIITGSHEFGPSRKRAGANKREYVTIGDGTWIGASVTILGGVTIGRGCVIAAGAIVTTDVPDNCLAGGVPAKVIKVLP